jgi:D-alanyl-D-alanine carboxypeptidase
MYSSSNYSSGTSLSKDLKKLKRNIMVLLTELNVPGAIISIRSRTYGNMDILYGYSNIRKKTPMDTRLIYPIASVTKTFTGTMFLQAYDENLVNLNESIDTCFVGIPNGENITIREVGNMTSGLFNYTESPKFIEVVKHNPYRTWSTMELVALGLTNPPYFPPGTDFHYSNTNTLILGASLERIYEQKYSKLLEERMIIPLGLKNTTFQPIVPDGGVTGYVIKGGNYVPTTGYNYSYSWAEGEIMSNVEDMHKYARKSIGQHQTISKKAYKEQTKWIISEVVEGITRKYGFQMEKIDNYIGHNGSIPGFSNFVLTNNASMTTIVVMCNLQFTESGINPANQITYLIVKTLPGY